MNYKDLRALFLRRFNIPKEQTMRKTIRTFTLAEKTVFTLFTSFFIISGIILLLEVNNTFLTEVPTRGGKITEGVVGNPRFINPALAISEADRNLVSLIYSGLVRITPDGSIENDLAESVVISEDKLNYIVKIDKEARFHDGALVTADDVTFTIQKIIDPVIKSPKRGNWDGVTLEKIDERTISFTLKQAYTPFIYNLTTGILPKHIWKNVSPDEFSFSQFNTIPIGSGPYQVAKVERNSGGIPNFYQLVPFEAVLGQVPFIEALNFQFYSSEETMIEAYSEGNVENFSGLSPDKILELNFDNSNVVSSPLPRVFAVFFNQNQSKVLLNKEVREALDTVAPRQEIINTVLGGYGIPINGPLPAGVYPWTSFNTATTSLEVRLAEARELLSQTGWKMNEETKVLEKKSGSAIMPLSFSISTGDAPELQRVAAELVSIWGKLGADIRVLTFETGDLNQNVIRPRNFDALLFGEVVGRDADLYPFWHSSQRTDPGLNIALYANSRADKFLDKARSSSDPEIIEENYAAFTKELEQDKPAVFLYTPSFLYVVADKVSAVDLGSLTVSQDRFLGIRDWFIEVDKVWQIFVK